MTDSTSIRDELEVSGEDADQFTGRLELLDPKHLNEAQRKVYDLVASHHIPRARKSNYVSQLPDGRLVGLYNLLLFSPRLTMGLGAWMDAQADCGLTDEVREVVILAVGASWRTEYQLYAHAAIARHIGLADEVIESIKAGREPEGISADATVAYRLASSLVNEHRLTDELYDEAISTFTISGVIALVHLIGLYLTVSALLNCFETPAPTG